MKQKQNKAIFALTQIDVLNIVLGVVLVTIVALVGGYITRSLGGGKCVEALGFLCK